ncbi:hypothetical protein FCL47_22405 [Desulfopila sp. IMCC35006]|uniref:hypothetical protein n=1 Tax=Desulfopila sp. IMCC35006 TaxID=2569542 RepID=UPI0010AB9A51|nr:hypothetical protein [Desulfopila sp. IMCC35006]TKB23508.1 hypothetical protein FCL47_22405 [Desulfopila sp. IMCC35006]
MTKEQEKDLFIEWSLYEPKEQKKIIKEYLNISPGTCSWGNFLNFLKEKLQIEGYWLAVGLIPPQQTTSSRSDRD